MKNAWGVPYIITDTALFDNGRVENLRRDWRETLLLILTCAVLFGSAGYFLGASRQGAVYEISGARTSVSYEVPAVLSQPAEETAAEESKPESPEETSAPMNVNTATKEELMELPGIGEVRAAAIVAYREEYGPFQTVEDLLLVSGIGERTLEGLIELVTVEEQD